jgi:hypothetical protein
MSAHADEEPGLPYTPSHTGRRSKVGYLGFSGVGFNDLWPLAAGLVGSLWLAFDFFLGEGWPRGSWQARTLVAALPFAAGFGYLRILVVGRPPHFKADLWVAACALRIDFGDPPFAWCPLWPRIWTDLAAAAGPRRARDELPPLARARSRRPGLKP